MFKKKFMGGAAVAALGLAALAPPALAQETTSTVRGEVVTSDGMPLAGARIVVTHEPTGTRAIETSSADGVFDLRGLRVGGPYTIEVSKDEFEDQKVSDVYLAVGEPYRVRVGLDSAADVIVVTGERVRGGVQIIGSGTKLGRDDIAGVVSVQRDIRDLARRDPLVTQDVGANRGGGGQGGIMIAGSAPRSNRITVDGMQAGDDFGLVTNGLSTLRGPVSLDAIEQFSVQVAPLDVSYGDFTGGALNVILRQGTNEFGGTAFLNYLNDGMVGERIENAAANTIVRQENYGGFLGGPIIKDRLFFAASYEYYESSDVSARGLANEGFSNVLQGFGGTGTTLSRADLNSVINPGVANQGYVGNYAVAPRFPVGDFSLTAPVSDEKYTGRIDWNINDDHRLSLSYRTAESSLVIRDFPANRGDLNSSWYTAGDTEEVYTGQLNSTWSSNFSTEVRASFRNYERRQQPPSGQEFGAVQICFDQTAGTIVGNATACTNRTIVDFGPDSNRHANLLNTTNTQVSASGEYQLGSHLIKGGVQYQGIDVFNIFVGQSDGVFYFDSIDAFNKGEMSRFQYTNSPTGIPERAAAGFAYNVQTAFLQDSWDVNDVLTLTYGLRYDYYQSPDKPAANPYFLARNGFSNQETYDGRDVLMPRFSFSYKPEQFELSGGLGLVSGGGPDVFLSNSFSNTGVLTAAVDIQRLTSNNVAGGFCREALSGLDLTDAQCRILLNVDKSNPNLFFDIPTGTIGGSAFSAQTLVAGNDPLNPANAGKTLANGGEVNALSPSFEIPSDWKGNFALKFKSLGFDFGVSTVATRSHRALAFTDTRARPLIVPNPTSADLAAGVTAGLQRTPDGRIRYDGLTLDSAGRALRGMTDAVNAASANGSSALIGGNRDIVAYNPDVASWQLVTGFSISREFENGLSFGLSYARQDGEDYGGFAQFGTTANGFYGEQYTDRDPNASTLGRPNGEIDDSFKFDFGWRGTPIGELESRLTLFAESRSGRPLNFLMSQQIPSGLATGSRSQVFGVNRADQLLYVPDLSTCTTGSGSLNCGLVTFATANDRNAFVGIVNQFGLPQNGTVPKGAADNPDVQQVDLQFSQEIPGLLRGHRGRIQLDIQNLLNLIDDDLGLVKEYTNSRASGRVANVDCADSTGAAVAATSLVCTRYRYSNVTSSDFATVPQTNANESRWFIQVGLKYEF